MRKKLMAMWKTLWRTFLSYLIGCVFGTLLSAQDISRASFLLTAVTVTAFVVSFKHPFASLAKSEWWQRYVLQYAPSALFGLIAPAVWQEAGIAGIVILLVSGSIHVSSWNNNSDSRWYRLQQFREGLAQEMPATNRVISFLNGRGLSDEADLILLAIFREKSKDECVSPMFDMKEIQMQFDLGQQWLFLDIAKELTKYVGVRMGRGIEVPENMEENQ